MRNTKAKCKKKSNIYFYWLVARHSVLRMRCQSTDLYFMVRVREIDRLFKAGDSVRRQLYDYSYY